MAISKSETRRLTRVGMEAGAKVLRGKLTIGPDGVVTINDKPLSEWLQTYNDEDVIFIAASVGMGNIAVEDEVRTCYTCGRDYKGATCPHCAEVRARLRG